MSMNVSFHVLLAKKLQNEVGLCVVGRWVLLLLQHKLHGIQFGITLTLKRFKIVWTEIKRRKPV